MRCSAASLAAFVVLSSATFAADLLDTEVHRLRSEQLLEEGRTLPESGYVSSNQPDAEVLDRIAEAGFAAVVDLRGEDEDRGIDEKSAVELRGMRYISLPLPSPADATYENAAKLQQLLVDVDGPVLLHCYSGNRVGALFALTAKEEGLSADEALDFGKAAGLTRWEDSVREELGLD